MMGGRVVAQKPLFYEFSLDRHVPTERLHSARQHSNNAWFPAPKTADVSDSGRASASAATASVAAVDRH